MPTRSPLEDTEVNCQCLDRELINVAPQVVLAFIISLLIVLACAAFLFLRPDWKDSLIPVMTAIGGLWIPSPAQNRTSSRRYASVPVQ